MIKHYRCISSVHSAMFIVIVWIAYLFQLLTNFSIIKICFVTFQLLSISFNHILLLFISYKPSKPTDISSKMITCFIPPPQYIKFEATMLIDISTSTVHWIPLGLDGLYPELVVIHSLNVYSTIHKHHHP